MLLHLRGKPYVIKLVNEKGLHVTGVCDRKGLVATFLRHLSLGTPYRSRRYLLLQMDEEKAVDHLLLPQRLSSACFYCQP